MVEVQNPYSSAAQSKTKTINGQLCVGQTANAEKDLDCLLIYGYQTCFKVSP